jgi:hypothetical protein
MSQDQVATWPQVLAHMAQQAFLGRTVKVDDDIAAEDDIELAIERESGHP